MSFHSLLSLPQPIRSASTTSLIAYPSVQHLGDTDWVVSTGLGTFYVIQTSEFNEPFNASLTAEHDLDLAEESASVLLQAVHRTTSKQCDFLVTVTTSRTEDRREIREAVLRSFSIDLGPASTGEAPQRLKADWSFRGERLPYWCGWDRDGWLIFAESPYRPVENTNGTVIDEEVEDGTALLTAPGLGFTTQAVPLDGEEAVPSVDDQILVAETAAPYRWTQTSDTITLTIPLPAGTPRGDFTVSLSSTEFSLTLVEPTAALAHLSLSHSWWSETSVSESTWTYDPDKSKLEIEITKEGDPNRWPSLFVPNDDDEEDEVPETFSAETLAAVRDSFKTTAREGEEPEGNHPAIPALLREEMDYDLEDGEDYGEGPEGAFGESNSQSAGRDCFIGKIIDGSAEWSKATTSILSTPLLAGSTFVTKSAVDGLLFQPSDNPVKDPWTHLSTSPALAFVLSSKRDLSAVRHITLQPTVHTPKRPKTGTHTTILAFENGQASGQGNVYVYYPPSDSSTARQAVLPVSGGARGEFSAVGAVEVGEGIAVVVLTEKELVLLHGIL